MGKFNFKAFRTNLVIKLKNINLKEASKITDKAVDAGNSVVKTVKGSPKKALERGKVAAGKVAGTVKLTKKAAKNKE